MEEEEGLEERERSKLGKAVVQIGEEEEVSNGPNDADASGA